jgi:Asp-tRNA(Asn)/Glu-tRNA(Gln) amidotransferase A subunit family amidase
MKTAGVVSTLNIEVLLVGNAALRQSLKFDDRKARSMMDVSDADTCMPDALEVAAEQAQQFAKTDKLVGPIAASFAVGIDIPGHPFSEPTLLRIAAACTAASHHRQSPAGFGAPGNH